MEKEAIVKTLHLLVQYSTVRSVYSCVLINLVTVEPPTAENHFKLKLDFQNRSTVFGVIGERQ